MKIVLLLISIFLCIANINCLSDGTHEMLYSKLAIDYFKTRRIRNINLYYCSSAEVIIDIVKRFSDADIAVFYSNIHVRRDKRSLDNIHRMENHKIGTVFDCTCFSNSTPYTTRYAYFNSSFVWLILDNGYFDRALQYLNTLPLSIVSDVILTKTVVRKNKTEIELYDVYNPGRDRGAEINVTFFGVWSENIDSEWKSTMEASMLSQRMNLNGIPMRVVSYADFIEENKDLHEYLTDEQYPYEDSVFKMNYQLILFLQQMYNFTIILIKANNWSDKNAMGAYKSGNLIGVIVDKKADLMGGALRLTPESISVTDTLHLTYPFRDGFIFKFTGEFGYLKITFLAPFENTIWYICIAMTVVIFIAISVIFCLEFKYLPSEYNSKWIMSDIFLTVWGSWCQMGSSVLPMSHSGRIVFFTIFLNSLILYNFYTSSIVSSLLSYRSQQFTLNDLADSSLKCGSSDTGYAKTQIFNEGNTLYGFFIKKKVTKDFYLDLEKGLDKVQTGEFAYHAEYNSLYNYIENNFKAEEICELREVDTVPMTKLGVLGQKRSPYTEMFRVGLMKARETGHLSLSLQKWQSRKPICQANKGTNEVNLKQIISFFVTLAIGLIISILIFISEHIYYIRKHSIPFGYEKENKNTKIKRNFNKTLKKRSWRKNLLFISKYGAEKASLYEKSVWKRNFFSYDA